MSRWLAIFDEKGRINPEDARKAFQVYRHFHAAALTELHSEKQCWMGIFGASAYADPSGVSVLWDGAAYDGVAPGQEASWLARHYLEMGRQGLDQLNGRWSFLLWDQKKGTLWMSRDRAGVKPLYYWRSQDRVVFASEPKLILALPFVERRVARESVFDYFVLGKVDAQQESLFEGIRQVMPAHELFIDLKKNVWEERRYFHPDPNPSRERFDPVKAKEYTSGVREVMENAVQRRLQYHAGPPATFLSGGLDSSTLACLIREKSPDKLTALTASYEEEGIAEQHWAKAVADRLDARWLQVFPTIKGLKDDLEDFIFSQDTPTFSSGTYSQYCLFRLAAAEGIPAVFDGQGADALFGGHYIYLPPLWRDLLLSGQWNTLWKEWRSFGPVWKAWAFGGVNWLKYKALPSMPQPFYHQFKRLYFPELQFLQPDLLSSNLERYRSPEKTGVLNATLSDGYFGGPLSFLLKCVDRASSWSGVETFTPYSDDARLMDYLFSIPGSYKIRGGVRKWLLRESCRDLLPETTYRRQDKMGLVTPNNAWMAQLRPIARACLEEQDDAIFNKKVLLREFDTFFNPASSLENYRVYKYLSLLIWRSVFKV